MGEWHDEARPVAPRLGGHAERGAAPVREAESMTNSQRRQRRRQRSWPNHDPRHRPRRRGGPSEVVQKWARAPDVGAASSGSSMPSDLCHREWRGLQPEDQCG
jgi:hypothetical protein